MQKTGGKAMKETLQKNKIIPNQIVDTYNKTITTDGIAPTICCGIDFRNNIYFIEICKKK